jgi:hypothetical protein
MRFIYLPYRDSSDSSKDDDDGNDVDSNDDEYPGPYDPMTDALDALIDSVVEYDDPSILWEHVRMWLQEHSIDETRDAIEYKGEFDTTALHVACRNNPPGDVIEVMLMASPDMIFWADSFGWLPVRVVDVLHSSFFGPFDVEGFIS